MYFPCEKSLAEKTTLFIYVSIEVYNMGFVKIIYNLKHEQCADFGFWKYRLD